MQPAEAMLRAERANKVLEELPFDIELSDLHGAYTEAAETLEALDDEGLDDEEREVMEFHLDELKESIDYYRTESIRVINQVLRVLTQLPVP